MTTPTAVMLYSAHPIMTALAAETTLTVTTPRTRVLGEIRSEVERAHQLVLAGDHRGAVRAYHAARNKILPLLHRGAPDHLPEVRDHFAAPHDLGHLKELVRSHRRTA